MPPIYTRLNGADEVHKRVDHIQDSVKRTRSALLLCILASGTMALCLWNTYGSWDRDFAFLDDSDLKAVPQMYQAPASLRIEQSKNLVDAIRTLCPRPQWVEVDDKGDKSSTTSQVEIHDPAFLGCVGQRWSESGARPVPVLDSDLHRSFDADVPFFTKNGVPIPREKIIEAAWKIHESAMPTDLQMQQIRSWVDTQTVSVSLLGIKISVSDFAVLGSLALLLCTYYMLLCARRENHEIGYLFEDLMSLRKVEPERFGALGYHTFALVSSLMVFNLGHVKSGIDEEIQSAKELPAHFSGKKRIRGIRRVSGWLHYMPAFTISATIICDFGWTFRASPFGHILFSSPFRPLSVRPFFDFDRPETVYFFLAEIFASLCLVIQFRMSRHVNRYESATRDLLDELETELSLAPTCYARRWEIRADGARLTSPKLKEEFANDVGLARLQECEDESGRT